MSGSPLKIGLSLLALGLLLSCGDADPTLPVSAEVPTEAAAHGLSIEEMLADPLFQSSIEYVTEESVLDPLITALAALERGQLARARNQIKEAQAEAAALLDAPFVDFDHHIAWSVLERYFEEADLI